MAIGRAAAVAVVTGVLVPTFMIARWGNELYEQTRTGEVTGVRALYDLAPPGSTLLAMNSHLPWRATAIDDYDYQFSSVNAFATLDMTALERPLAKNPTGGFIIITTGQIDYGVEVDGLPPEWGTTVEQALERSSVFRLVFSNSDTRIYQYEGGPDVA